MDFFFDFLEGFGIYMPEQQFFSWMMSWFLVGLAIAAVVILMLKIKSAITPRRKSHVKNALSGILGLLIEAIEVVFYTKKAER